MKKSEKAVLRRLALPISVVINEVGDLNSHIQLVGSLLKMPFQDQMF